MSRTIRNEQQSITPESWLNTKNGSLFIKYIPNHIDKTSLRSIFNFLGQIARIDIVNISENGTGRRAFIHFHEWNDTEESLFIRKNIVSSYPVHFMYPNEFYNFQFSITMNTRPIPTTELNLYQIQDWNQRLNDEFCDYKKRTEIKMNSLLQQNNLLFNIVNELRSEMMMMKTQSSNSDKMISSDSSMKEEEIQLFDLDSVEAGIRRPRDPLIYERNSAEETK
jgi:hypothetical protein